MVLFIFACECVCDSRRCRDDVDDGEKSAEVKSSYATYNVDDDDDDSRSVAAAAAYDAINISRPVSQTSFVSHRSAHDDAREIP